jgi:hydroxyacylglutathione hydrolase
MTTVITNMAIAISALIRVKAKRSLAMLIREFVDEGLGNTSYLVASEESGEAAVIDAERDVDRYVRAAEGFGPRLRYALDTHLHNDFVSGVRELALLPGLQIGASAGAELGFDHLPLREGDTLSLGELTLGILATPGHTPEHISFTLTQPNQANPAAVFTGGALMVGGAARTDLLGPEWTTELARQLHHSLHGKLLTLPDTVRVYPTHGAGSFCAAPVSAERTTTIGRERATNYLARATGVDEFVALATSDLPTYPAYFREMRAINQRGPAVLGGLPAIRPMNPDDVVAQQVNGAVIVDLRPTYEFVAGHIPGSFSIALRDAFGTWVGWVVPFGTPIILISHETPAEHEAAVRQLIRVGYDRVVGYLAGGLAAWQAAGQPLARWSTITPGEVHDRLAQRDGLAVVDVRQRHEWQAGHIKGAVHAEAGTLAGQPLALKPDQPIAVHCGHHDRAATGLALLERRGFKNLSLIEGRFGALEEAGLPTEPSRD